MSLDELAEYAEEHSTGSTSDETNVRLSTDPVQRLKKAVGVSTNAQAAPAIDALIYSELGMDEEAEEARERFRDQFDDGE